MHIQSTASERPSFGKRWDFTSRHDGEVVTILERELPFVTATGKTVSINIRQATTIEDKTQAMDFVVDLNGKEYGVGSRIRDHRYYTNPEYREEFTIRYSYEYCMAELNKILDGKGSYYLYGFEDVDKNVGAYTLFRLDVFRHTLKQKPELMQVRKQNKDTDFIPFKFADFPPEMIVVKRVFPSMLKG